MISVYTKPLKENVIRQWLAGKNRDTIANENGLSTGTVSNLVKEWGESVGSLAADEVREFGVTLRKSDLTPIQCAKGFRILNLLHDLGYDEEGVEQFLLRMYKMCKNIGLQPDKIALHINELVGLIEKVPLAEISDYINRKRSMLEELNQELEIVSTQLKEAQAKFDKAFSRYNIDRSEARWTFWLKRELAERGLKFNNISALVNTIEDFYVLGFDARKIMSKVSENQDLETRANALKSEISKLQKDKENEARQLAILKQFSSTHIQANYVYEQLKSMGFGLGELTSLHNMIIELAKENGFSESTAIKKFMDDVTKNYRLVQGFESRVEELKSEAEDTEAGMIMLRQSEAELDNVTSSLRKLWAMGITSDDIVNLAKSLDKETINNNIDQENKTINSDNFSSDLKQYHNLKTDIENLNKDKNELIVEISVLMSTRDWLATSIITPLTFRAVQYLNFISRVIKCMRIYVQVQVLNSYMTYNNLPTTYSKTQELNIGKLSIPSDSNQKKFLSLIKSACGNNIKFNKLKNALIDAIRNGLDKLKSGNGHNKSDDTNITNTIAALNHEKLALEHSKDNSCYHHTKR
ncbi:MAG TPA: hypothetical protein VH500_20535 [Nitrososphaeraceae archaeon]